MKPERWERLKEVFTAALEHEAGRRTEFLRRACAGDESLRAEVESMLSRHTESPDFLESPALLAEAQGLATDLEDEDTNADGLASASEGRMPGRLSPPSVKPPWWMYFLAAIFLSECLIRLYCVVLGPAGFDFGLQIKADWSIVDEVPPGSEADRVGLKPGDIIRALGGQPIRSPSDWKGIRANLEPGRSYRLEIERMGERLQFTYPMGRVKIRENWGTGILAMWQINGLLLLGTAFLIVFNRPHDFLARMGALALATLAVSFDAWAILPNGYAHIFRGMPWGIGALLWIPLVCSYLVGPILLTFFILFPRPLFHVRWPWAIIWLPPLCFVPVFFRTTFLMVFRPASFYGNLMSDSFWFLGARLYGLYGLASVAALAVHYFWLTDPNDRRRLRVLFVGGGAAVLPGAVRLLTWGSQTLTTIFGWLYSITGNVLLALVFALFPPCFTYSILRHRLLDIHVIIRQGIQYAVTRRALLSAVPVLCVILVIDLLLHGDQPLISIVAARGWVYAGLGATAVAAHSQRRRWGEAIDRRFFREQYDARRLLREVAAAAGRARSLAQAAPGVVGRIVAALHPEFAAIMQRSSGETVFRALAAAPSDKAPIPLDADSGVISMLRDQGEPFEVVLGKSGWLERQLAAREIALLRRSRIELFVPISMAPECSEALLALGTKRSEEPYTREDQDLLSSIAANLALLLERPEVPSPPRGEFEECPQCGTCYDSGAGRCTQESVGLTPIHLPRTFAGRYHLERRLGRGGMGAVYESTDYALGRRVAVKVLREDRLYSSDAAQRFQREARAAAGFSHPNVVTVYDYGVEAGTRPFLVMELLKGATLRDELLSQRRLSAERTFWLFRSLCSGVEAAHSRHLIHRDLKPENIFLARDSGGGDETVKVLDFGIAKYLAGREEGTETQGVGETDAGILVGTPGYMSPEQLLGDSANVSWDLWALAVTAYETLTGALPFPGTSRERWRQSVLAGAYTPLSEHLNNVPVAWKQFFDLSLAADRARRPQSAAEFLHVMEKAFVDHGCPNAFA